MSDECAYCGGRGAGCHPAGVQPDSPAPLSPIALDFEAAERETACGSKLMVEMAVSGVRFHLNAQLRALVARVAQEEREKCAKELEARAERLFNDPALGWRFDEQSRRIRLACAAFLRGTP